ncbi:MAG: hypothetical protein CEE40_09300 [Chloroflexi bacterium B3_Chlor]|nr:MAG: hypothetical protein CEE40_09300 [Chloroflexi bacterium B3_Chlor]
MNVTDGQLNIDLGPTVDEGIISGIEVLFSAYPPTPTPVQTPTFTPTNTPTPTFTPVAPPDLTIWGAPGMDPGHQTVPDNQTVPPLPTPEWAAPAWTPVAITTDVFNDSTGPCNEFFWTDLYVYTDTAEAPLPNEAGVAWQGLGGLGPNTGTTITFTHSFTASGIHYLYTQADSFQFVQESNENNNVSEPLTVTIYYAGPIPTPTYTATPDPTCGSISGTAWAWIGGQRVVPTERVDVSLYFGTTWIETTQTGAEGRYRFDCVAEGSGYTAIGTLEASDGTLYRGSEIGIGVLAGQETSNIDITMYEL